MKIQINQEELESLVKYQFDYLNLTDITVEFVGETASAVEPTVIEETPKPKRKRRTKAQIEADLAREQAEKEAEVAAEAVEPEATVDEEDEAPFTLDTNNDDTDGEVIERLAGKEVKPTDSPTTSSKPTPLADLF